jgi:hypothetical protein
MAWQTAYAPSSNSTFTSSGSSNARNVIAANTSSHNGYKVRVTVQAGSGGNATLNGCSIGTMSSGDTYDATPTRITWDSGNNGTTVTASSTKVSDEITFTFDKTVRHGIHIYCADEVNFRWQNDGVDGTNWDAGASDDTMTLNPSLSAVAGDCYYMVLVEVDDSPPGYTLTVDSGALSLSGTASSLEMGRKLAASAGSLSLSGTAMNPEMGRKLGADSGSLSLLGIAMSPEMGRKLGADSGSLSLSGTAMTPLHDKIFVPSAGSLSLSGTAMSPLHNKKLGLDAGNLSLSGSTVTLTYTPGAGVVVLGGSYEMAIYTFIT